MAIIVDKIKKRQDIAMACKDVLLNNEIKCVSISQLTKTAGISKGSFYDYFINKEDLIFEVINIALEKHNKVKEDLLQQAKTYREKIKVFLKIYYTEDDKDLKTLFLQFISVCLSQPKPEILEYQSKNHEIYFNWLKQLFEEGIEKGELKAESMKLIKGMFFFGSGLFLSNSVTNLKYNAEDEIDNFVDSLFDLIEIKH